MERSRVRSSWGSLPFGGAPGCAKRAPPSCSRRCDQNRPIGDHLVRPSDPDNHERWTPRPVCRRSWISRVRGCWYWRLVLLLPTERYSSLPGLPGLRQWRRPSPHRFCPTATTYLQYAHHSVALGAPCRPRRECIQRRSTVRLPFYQKGFAVAEGGPTIHQ